MSHSMHERFKRVGLKRAPLGRALLGALAVSVISPALASASFAGDYSGTRQMSEPNIVEIAAGNSNFSTLVAAVQAADLGTALSSPGPFTVFAPVNQAFADLPDGTVQTLLRPENKAQLTSILTYHVVAGEYFAENAPAGTYQLNTLQGDTVEVIVDAHGAVTVDGARVVLADVDASNGVIHAIDGVIMPGH